MFIAEQMRITDTGLKQPPPKLPTSKRPIFKRPTWVKTAEDHPNDTSTSFLGAKVADLGRKQPMFVVNENCRCTFLYSEVGSDSK